MNKLVVIILSILGLLILSKFLPSNTNSSVIINEKKFEVYVANTGDEKQKGLSIFDELPMNKGMVFVFSRPDYHAFWMKDMKFPIDIIYIQDSKIVYIFQNVPLPSSPAGELLIYRPSQKANYVLEINAGLSKKYKFRIGDKVKINL